jgi:hypothetical protein
MVSNTPLGVNELQKQVICPRKGMKENQKCIFARAFRVVRELRF